MSMSLAQLWQIVADAKNDLHVVEQELAKLIDKEEKLAKLVKEKKRATADLLVYERFLPVGTYLLSEEEHRMAPIGTRISEKDLRDGKMASLVWEKVGPNHWRAARPGCAAPYTDAEICEGGPYHINVVVEPDLAKLIDAEEKADTDLPVYENSLPVGTVLVTYEDHVKAPIGTLIREYDYDTDEIGTWSWRKVGPDKWTEYDPVGPTHFPLDTAGVTQVLPHIVNKVVDS